jgi:mono/diheme cytochrome c family protein
MMNTSYKVWVSGLLAVGLLAVLAAGSIAQEPKKELKKEPARVTSPASGIETFTSYCAACHGKDAKGDGPAAAALKTAPADLTTLARRNNGKYPEPRVTSILGGQTSLASHGDQEMPVWGPVFRQMNQGSEALVQMRIRNLNRYLESLQTK